MSNTNNPNKIGNTPTSIYKLNYVVNGIIKIIYVFYGKTVSSNKQNELFKEIFTNKELENINNNKIQVVFCDQMIHYDDSIGTIKIKILTEIKNPISLEEIYLFCQKIETLNAVSLYQSLIPMGTMIAIIGLTLYYWIDKYNLLRRSSVK